MEVHVHAMHEGSKLSFYVKEDYMASSVTTMHNFSYTEGYNTKALDYKAMHACSLHFNGHYVAIFLNDGPTFL